MAGNSNLHMSRSDKADEFYTKLSLIESELKHYKKHFEGKIVFCNCDDPFESNFFKFFAMNFNSLKLKKLIATCYATSPVIGNELNYYVNSNGQLSFLPHDNSFPFANGRQPYRVVINEVRDLNGDGRTDLADVEYLLKNQKNTLSLLSGDGDFRSDECIDLLKQADIVCTNPPFSLFREYIDLLVSNQKHFLIIGNQNNVCYSDVFPLIRDNKVWLGYNNGHFWFKVPSTYEVKKTDFKIDENGQKWRRMGNICWFTNLDIDKRHEDMPLFRNYDPEKYPKYDNYDAIEVSKTMDIPSDYFGVMGVPITFMQYYNPDQFVIIGQTHSSDLSPQTEKLRTDPKHTHRGRINGVEKYARLLIQRKQVTK